MSFKLWKRELVYGRKGPIAPILSISKRGLTLNKASMKVVGQDKKWVILFYDPDKDKPKVGLWFWKEAINEEYKQHAYKLTKYTSNGTARINSRLFVQKHRLYSIAQQIGQKSFLLTLDKSFKSGPDFYVAEIARPE